LNLCHSGFTINVVEVDMKLSDLDWYERSPESYYGKDKEGNVYNMYLEPKPGMRLDPYLKRMK